MSANPYTAEQQAAIDSDANILAVDAFAGTGKTSTLVGFARARPRARILYIAFNRSIAQSAKERFPQNVECRTTHSLAFAAVGRKFADKLGSAAPFDIARKMNVSNRRAKQALDTISAWLCTTDAQIGLDHLPKEDLAEGTGTAIVNLARAIWAEMTNLKSPIKMPHDGYLKLWAMSQPKLRYDYILLDEAQDTNPLTLDLVLSQKAHAKLVLVGDKHQGIYGFRKAVNAMKCVPADERVAITQSFRFANGIAAVASALLREYKQEPNAIRGRDDIEASWQVDLRRPYAILSRTNAALFGALASLVTRDKPVKAVHYVGGFDGYIFGKVLDAYYLWSNQRQSIRDESITRFPDFSAFKEYGEEANDPEVKALVKVVEQYRCDVPSIYNALKAAEVPEDRAAVSVSTAHKSKGLEWEQVVLTDDFITLPPEEDDYDPEEINLLYVAITRAIRALEATPSVKALVDELAEAQRAESKSPTAPRRTPAQAISFKETLCQEYERTWQQLETAMRNPSMSPSERAALQGRLEALSWVAEKMALSLDAVAVS